MSKLSKLFTSDKFLKIILKMSIVISIVFLLSPIFSMLAYLIVNDYSGKDVSTYSLVPADVFYYILCFAGAFGLLMVFLYIFRCVCKKDSVVNKRIFAAVIILLVWILICDFLSKDKQISFFGALYREEGFFSIVAYVGIAGLAYILFINKNKYFELLLKIVITVSSVIAFLVFLESCTVYIPFFESGSYKTLFTGPFYNSNHLGYYLTISMMAIIGLFYLKDKKIIKIILLIIFALHSYVLVLNNTFGCFLAVLFGIIMLIVLDSIRDGKIVLVDFSFLAILFLMALVVLITPYQSVFADFLRLTKDVSDIVDGKDANHAGSSRWLLWKSTLREIGKNPIFGIGSDMSTREMLGGVCDRPHNEFMQYTLFYGIFGGILYFTLLIIVLLPCLINVKKISKETFVCFLITISYLFSSLFGNTTYYITPLFAVFFAGCIYFYSIKKENVTNSDDEKQLISDDVENDNMILTQE